MDCLCHLVDLIDGGGGVESGNDYPFDAPCDMLLSCYHSIISVIYMLYKAMT